jgi:hypothetical protein
VIGNDRSPRTEIHFVYRGPYFRMYLIGGVAFALIAVVAVTLAFTVKPEPLTGDVEADAACSALMSAAIEDGQTSGAKLATLSDDERSAIVREVMEHSERSTIEEIRTAGAQLGAANVIGPIPLLGGNFAFLASVSQFGSVCAEHGWSPRAAGLLDE